MLKTIFRLQQENAPFSNTGVKSYTDGGKSKGGYIPYNNNPIREVSEGTATFCSDRLNTDTIG